MFDVVIVGGGPAGLSAALVLGRCRRRVLVCDAGQPRNAASHGLHGYLTRDGTPPLEFLRLARDELAQYGIEPRTAAVTEVARHASGFDVTLDAGERVLTRAVLLATGVQDHVPDIPGLRECYGRTVHHCPYCDGWEVRDKALVVLGRFPSALGLALSLRTWTSDITICSNGAMRVRALHRAQLTAHKIGMDHRRIEQVEHDGGRVRAVRFADGAERPCDAIFFSTGQQPQSDLPRALGCEITRKGVVKTDHLGQTCVPGLYVAGDASRDVQFVIVAAAEGAKAAVAINKALQAHAGLALQPLAS